MTDFTPRSQPCTSLKYAPESIMQYFKCSVCVDVLKDPVTTNCGHTFCKLCLESYMSSNNRICPVCKSTLSEFMINIFLKEILKELQKPRTRSPDEFTGQPGEVACDVCDEDLKYKAVKSCLLCLLSFCKRHLNRHCKLHTKGHKMVAPLNDLDQWACLVHGRPLELYLVSEKKLICSLCVQGGKNVMSVEEERDRKHAELGTVINKIEQGIQQRKKNIQELDNSASNCLNLINNETMEIKNIFHAIKKAVEKAEDEALKPLEVQRKKVEKRAKDLKWNLMENISALSKTISDLQTLRNEEDPVIFLQRSSTTAVDDASDWTSVFLDTDLSFGTIKISEVTMMANIKNEFEKLSRLEVSRIKKFGVDVTLDPGTANTQLLISDDMRQVRNSEVKWEASDCPERFDMFGSILGQNRLTDGRAFWVVEIGIKQGWDIGVAREEANRKGPLSIKPSKGYWVIVHYNGENYAALEDTPTLLSLSNAPCKVGVFVDYSEKLVSFYDMEAETHIYSFTDCEFRGVIRPFFSPHIIQEEPLVICPLNPNN